MSLEIKHRPHERVLELRGHDKTVVARVPDRFKATAYKMAAAPELLDALMPLASLDMVGNGDDMRDDDKILYARDKTTITVGDVRRARAAIAKAKGEAP